MKFFCRQQGEAFAQIEAHLITKHTNGAGPRSIVFLNALIEDETEEILVSLQNPVIWRAKVKSYMIFFLKAFLPVYLQAVTTKI